jgi:hypothetical protein
VGAGLSKAQVKNQEALLQVPTGTTSGSEHSTVAHYWFAPGVKIDGIRALVVSIFLVIN